MEKTYYAPVERSAPNRLEEEIEIISNNPVTDELMKIVTGLFAILNEHRQILAVNDNFLKMLHIEDVKKVFGLRPGELVQCIHANDLPGGCGTSEFCSTCGAVVAILTSLRQKRPVEKVCAITVEKNNNQSDLFFRARSCPINIEGSVFILLFLQDISRQQQWATIERAFFHDISNLLHGILGRSELMISIPGIDKDQYAEEIHNLCLRLTKEVEIQKHLSQSEMHTYSPLYTGTTLERVFKELKSFYQDHKVAHHKILELPKNPPDVSFQTDLSLLIRILSNMITNAFEASAEGDHVKVTVEHSGKWIVFSVWNRQMIPEDIAKRIFQRNFSTKDEFGRGLGTFSMKYFGEKILGGEIDFSTSPEKGTVFNFRMIAVN